MGGRLWFINEKLYLPITIMFVLTMAWGVPIVPSLEQELLISSSSVPRSALAWYLPTYVLTIETRPVSLFLYHHQYRVFDFSVGTIIALDT